MQLLSALAGKAQELDLGSLAWIILLPIFVAYFLSAWHGRRREDKKDEAFARFHGCLPMETKIPYKWPLGLDILKYQYDALKSQRLLAFQSPDLVDKMNVTLNHLGRVGYVTTDPKNIEIILSTKFEDFDTGTRRGALLPQLGEGIFTQDGPPWKHSRDMLRRHVAHMNIRDLTVFDQHVNPLLNALAESQGVVDLQPFFFRLTLATTTSLIFGDCVTGLSQEAHDAFASALDYASSVSLIRLRLANFHWILHPRRFSKACETIKSYASHIVDVNLRNAAISNSTAEAESESEGLTLALYKELEDPALVRDQLVNVLIAGRDTTACLLSWTFFLLVRHPNVLKRLQKEITSVWPEGQHWTRADIQKLSYLRNILNETLRLYPQPPINERMAKKTTCLARGGGPNGDSPVLIRRGTGIGYSLYHMHRHTSLYGADASEFRPERWEGQELDNIGWGFLPFSGGPRTCLGKDFAFLEASYCIVRVLQNFPKLRLPPGELQVPTGQEKQSFTYVLPSAQRSYFWNT